jgi:hypothetical protein
MRQITTTDTAGPAALRALARQLRVDEVRAARALIAHPAAPVRRAA